ncbi:MAG TPA: S1 RNA-binding domain-containing protein [Planctomycetota bacterium]|jgi:ribosomal protein S1|nr:S1 RNA-binding domain-containing protein [Planctomycetota bacterium]OQC20455.1 MAG: 30S ribosomal protein S1 [Planctomycetes bacterium ADurb.Bin069]NMD36145.1 S1 RNA-binding domain-containing protein [Planctomycetota bacterium]HNR99073.1 S1 RNA-binding domain-containing protein [Planctomycetota bacterium]HNU26234.1 S1 RNA-binding domain-containing protein [Planctomycetota bacterium]
MIDKRRKFHDDDERRPDAGGISDEQLEALMARGGMQGDKFGPEPELDLPRCAPGTRLRGTVVNVRGGEIVVELAPKAHGFIPDGEFEDEPLPKVGARLEANFVRYDAARDMAILSIAQARTEVLWEELRPGMVLKGLVTGVNKGGLEVSIKGVRAFMPISQIERERVEDASQYVGKTLTCEVASFDRADRNVVVSRRAVLEREAREERGKVLARLNEGDQFDGTIVRLNEFGAFVDIGGAEGLLHRSKIEAYYREYGREKPLKAGQRLRVQVVRVEAGRGRIGLDFPRAQAAQVSRALEGYAVGETVAGWVRSIGAEGAYIALDEGVEGFVPSCDLGGLGASIRQGSVVRGTVARIDKEKNRIEIAPG